MSDSVKVALTVVALLVGLALLVSGMSRDTDGSVTCTSSVDGTTVVCE